MSLNLDDRQRAMLDAMGVTVWWPQQAAVLVPVAAASNAIDIEANNPEWTALWPPKHGPSCKSA